MCAGFADEVSSLDVEIVPKSDVVQVQCICYNITELPAVFLHYELITGCVVCVSVLSETKFALHLYDLKIF